MELETYSSLGRPLLLPAVDSCVNKKHFEQSMWYIPSGTTRSPVFIILQKKIIAPFIISLFGSVYNRSKKGKLHILTSMRPLFRIFFFGIDFLIYCFDGGVFGFSDDRTTLYVSYSPSVINNHASTPLSRICSQHYWIDKSAKHKSINGMFANQSGVNMCQAYWRWRWGSREDKGSGVGHKSMLLHDESVRWAQWNSYGLLCW